MANFKRHITFQYKDLLIDVIIEDEYENVVIAYKKECFRSPILVINRKGFFIRDENQELEQLFNENIRTVSLDANYYESRNNARSIYLLKEESPTRMLKKRVHWDAKDIIHFLQTEEPAKNEFEFSRITYSLE